MNSWVESANLPDTDFPLENLPYGMFDGGLAVAIGDFIFDLGAIDAPASLNELMALPGAERSALRTKIQTLLAADQPRRKDLARFLIPQTEAVMRLPVQVGDYTDFYASIFHATNVGKLFRPDNPLLPNYKHIPIAYHGRASSLVVSGTEIPRPHGQIKAGVFGPTRSLDFELEAGFYIAEGNALGHPVPIEEAEPRIFGFSLVNDWSARDIQAWEYQPLGPFLGKSFSTSVSPWVVTRDALEPFRAPEFARPEGDPAPLPYLDSPDNRARGAFDVTLEVWLSTAQMRERGFDPIRICRSSMRDLYWTPAQMVTHHTSNGCNLRPGDLLATGTVSGDAPTARGCLLELTRRGEEPLRLPTGETRAFLEDGDEVILKGWCERSGVKRIGFGECRGVVVG
jgi:fumarylacetoacetase